MQSTTENVNVVTLAIFHYFGVRLESKVYTRLWPEILDLCEDTYLNTWLVGYRQFNEIGHL